MPCFRNAPDRGTDEYEKWLPEVESRWRSFRHVVDYYYAKASVVLPHPATVTRDDLQAWGNPLERPQNPIAPVDWDENQAVIRQILLHIDCDGVDVFQLNDISNFLTEGFVEGTMKPEELGYLWALYQCFSAMRNNEV